MDRNCGGMVRKAVRMMVQINMSIPESCAECRLSVRHFGKLYCPYIADRVGNEGKDARCPLVDAEGMEDLISRQDVINAIENTDCELSADAWDELTDAIMRVPSAQSEVRAQMSSADCISRQAAIDAIDDANDGLVEDDYTYGVQSGMEKAKYVIEYLPSVQPNQSPYVAEIESEYKKWVNIPYINKPLAKAMYEVWKRHDREDVSRNE